MDSKQRSRSKAWKEAGVSMSAVVVVLGAFVLSPEGAELLSKGPGWLVAAIPVVQWLARYFRDQSKHGDQFNR